MPQSGRAISGRQVGRQVRRSMLRFLSTLALLTLVVVVLGGCAGLNDSGTHPDFLETQAANQPEDGDNGHGGEGAETPEAEGTEPAGGDEEDLVAVGQELATSSGCVACHSIDGSVGVGPSWQGLYGHEVTLDDGSTVPADEAYIAESIRNPGEKIVEGFQNVMPATFADWTDDQVNAIIAFIQSLD